MGEANEKEGCCSSCGFLAKFDVRFEGPPPYIYEMPPKDRSTGEMSCVRLEKNHEIYCFPQCYVKADDLWGKLAVIKEREGQSNFQAVQRFFDEDRQCKKWHPYTPGFSPQKHLEDVRMQQLELERQKFEQKMVKDHKDFMSKLDADNKCFQLKVTCVLGLIAIVEIIVTGLQLLYPAGLPWLQSIPPMPGF